MQSTLKTRLKGRQRSRSTWVRSNDCQSVSSEVARCDSDLSVRTGRHLGKSLSLSLRGDVLQAPVGEYRGRSAVRTDEPAAVSADTGNVQLSCFSAQ